MELVLCLRVGFLHRRGKATTFGHVCKALGVQFDLAKSDVGLMTVCNTEARRQELVEQILKAVERMALDRQETLSLWGRPGFADSFLHGRLGKLVLKHSVDHAYGPSRRLEPNLVTSLKAMAERLQSSKPRVVTSFECEQWCIYTDASFEQSTFTGGLGGVLVNEQTEVCAWFGICLDESTCISLDADCKGTIIYELELLATVLATCVWCQERSEILHGIFGYNDGVRFSSIRTVASAWCDGSAFDGVSTASGS